ncbi:MAG TPA: hypothetical protein VG347_14020 [Verrucomicrobiae bacterium]|nr:hypothetical protein [Verrucomicrobiae bacterium]
MRRKLQTLVLLLLPLLTGGCLTQKLWTESALDEWNEPATPANLRVFDAGVRKDFLVVYDERSGRHSTLRTRAYFLNQNLDRLREKHAPRFASPGLTNNFAALPLLHQFVIGGSNAPARPFVVSTTNTTSFAIYFPDGAEEYQLPVYADNVGGYERAALTPLAVTADVTMDASIVGGVAAYFWLYTGAPGLVR